MTTTLVTGGAGFVGSAVVRRLLAAGHAVRVLVRPDTDTQNLGGLPITSCVGDITDKGSLVAAMRGCRYVFHVAALYRLWHPRAGAFHEVNVAGTDNVLDAASTTGIERLVYTSSVATLGRGTANKPADESTPVTLADMIGPYKRSKFIAEGLVKEAAARGRVDAVIVHPSAPIGPRDTKPTPTGRWIRDAVRGATRAYVDTGLNIVHVDDVAAGQLLALERGKIGEGYVLGAENLTLYEILRRIATLTDGPAPRIRLHPTALLPIAWLSQAWARLRGGREPRVTVDGLRLARHEMFFSSAKAERELGYRPRPADEALNAAVGWFSDRAR